MSFVKYNSQKKIKINNRPDREFGFTLSLWWLLASIHI